MLLLQKAGTKNTFVWESDGQNGFDISESEQLEDIGTSIKLFLRKDAKDYLDSFKIKSLVKKYSDHITVPINVKDNDNEAEQANSAQALWTRSSSSIKNEEYSEFYKSNFGALMIHICIYTIKLKVRSILLTYFLFQKQRHLTFMSLSERRALVYT